MTMKRWLAATALSLLASMARGGDWGGQVVGIHDGDTLSVLRNGVAVKVRLDEIDAPEFGQDYGRQAKKSLSSLCYGKRAEIWDHGQDKYGRSLGRVLCGGIDANAEQVRRGYAWFYVQYGRDPHLRELEDTARAQGAGLWAAAGPMPPWEYRRRGRTRATTPARPPFRSPPAASPRAADGCASPRRCRDFATCGEAMAYLHRCGSSAMDRNRDGVPCEATLCR